MDFSERIATIMKHYALQPKELAEKCGVQRTAINHILNGRNRPSVSFLSELSQAFPELNTRWLLHGKGTMFTSVTEKPADSNETSVTAKPSIADSVVTNVDICPDGMREEEQASYNLMQGYPLPNEGPRQADQATSAEGEKAKQGNAEQSEVGARKRTKEISSVIILYTDGSFERYRP